MLVILMKDQLLEPSAVCKSCPMASQSGLPRWQKGRLRCGRPIDVPVAKCASSEVEDGPLDGPLDLEAAASQCPAQYECTMGFRVAELADTLC